MASSSLADRLIEDLGSDFSDQEQDSEHGDDVNHDQKEIDDDGDAVLPDVSAADTDDQPCNDLNKHLPAVLANKLNELEAQVTKYKQDDDGVPTQVSSDATNVGDEEYQVVIACAAAIGEVDEVITSLHAQLASVYRPGFPELETLVVNAMDYARVAELAYKHNGDFSEVNLQPILPSASVITVQITASSSAGRKLTGDEWAEVGSIAHAMQHLDEKRGVLLSYIQYHAKSVAPNLVAIVGGVIAAKLIAQVGGLEPLAKIPGGNFKVIGRTTSLKTQPDDDETKGGKEHQGKHDGFIATCPLVMQLPPKLRRKAAGIVAGKASLAVRVDAQRTSRDGSVGQKFREALDAKFVQMQERPPAKSAKPLPVPGDEAKRRHRGGARARKEKERMGLTEAWKLANRVKFNVTETVRGNDLENEGLGMLGAPDSQRIKVQTKKSAGLTLAANRKLDKHKKMEGVSDAERLGITSNIHFSVPPPSAPNGSPSDAPNLSTSVDGSALRQPQPGQSSQSVRDDPSKVSNYFTPSTPFLGVDKKTREISKKT